MSNKVVNKETLGYLGEDYQDELVKMFIEDPPFFKGLVSIIDQNMFTNDINKRVVGFMKERYEQNETVASYKDLDTMARGKISDQITVESVVQFLDKIKDTEPRGIDLIENEAERFFKQQNLTKAMRKANEIVSKGMYDKYYEIEDIIKKALEVNTKQDFGYQVFDGMEEALSEDYRCAIPTGADKLDELLQGGLAKGELGVIIAPSGVGKTSSTTGFAAHAAMYKCEQNHNKGFKVLHIHFEDEDKNIKRKYYAYLTEIESSDLSKPGTREYVIDQIKTIKAEGARMIQENVRCFHPSSGEMSASEIYHKVSQYIARGFYPDLIIVDYFECLKLEKGDGKDDSVFVREGMSMRKLENIAHDFNVALWCPVQGTKDSIGSEVVGMGQAGGSVKKVQIGHVIISLARTEEMAQNNRITIRLSKFRGGKITTGGVIENVEFNNGLCRFNTSNSTMSDTPSSTISSDDVITQTARDVQRRQQNQ